MPSDDPVHSFVAAVAEADFQAMAVPDHGEGQGYIEDSDDGDKNPLGANPGLFVPVA